MNKEEFKQSLINAGFSYERDNEYHRDVYTNKDERISTNIGNFAARLEISIDYYTVIVIWRTCTGKRIGKSYYNSTDMPKFPSLEAFLAVFLLICERDFNVNINNYRIN